MKQEIPQAPIGSPCTPGYYSFEADRAPHIPIDRKRIRTYDLQRKELARWVRRMASWWLKRLILIGWLIALGRWWAVALGAALLIHAVCCGHVGLLWMSIRYLRILPTLYWNSSLAGAVVVGRDPLTALGLIRLGEEENRRKVSVCFDGQGRPISEEEYNEGRRRTQEEWDRVWKTKYDEAEYPEDDRIWDKFWGDPCHVFSKKERETIDRTTVWGCQTVVVEAGDWERYYKTGDRMPCSSTYAERDERTGLWREAGLLPLVWGTDNRRDLSGCVDAIPPTEWRLLDEVAPLAAELEPNRLYRIVPEPAGAEPKFRLVRMVDEED